MVGSPGSSGLILRIACAALAVLACRPVCAQTALSLSDLGERGGPPNYLPAHAGERVAVRGVVSAPPFHFPTYTLLAIQDAQGGGVLQSPSSDFRLDGLRPGFEVEAEGVVAGLAGMPVVAAESVRLQGQTQPPAPLAVSLRDVSSFPRNLRYLGRLVRVEGRMSNEGDTTAGGQLLVGNGAETFKLFVPSASGQPDLSAFERGDLLSATGVALQFCPLPPYNRFFELLVNDPAGIVVAERSWTFPPLALVAGLAAVLCVAFFLWGRESRQRKQRERLRKTYQLGEEVLGSSSAEAILQRISESLPGILGITRVQLYVHNRAAKTLDAASEDSGPADSISLSSPPGGTPAGAAACFHYRTLLVIPDIDRSPFPIATDTGGRTPKSLLLVPMMAQGEVAGVLELDQDDRARDFTADEQSLAQHLGNQIGVAIRLLDQRSVQEQLFRTEKLAAIGRLISGIADELQAPLASISELAAKAIEKADAGPAGLEVSAIAAEARKAAGMVARLTAFGGSEVVEARPVCISTLLRRLVEFRQADWKASGIRSDSLISREPLSVLGSLGQLERVFLNLLVHAEQSLAEAPQKTILIRTSVLVGRRLLVEIAFTASPDLDKADEAASVLSVARSVIGGHGGEARLVVNGGGQPCFEVELPIAVKERAAVGAAGPASDPARRMTALLIEPEDAAQRQILALLAAQGCRVVPVEDADVGLELAQRMRFDATFCSVHAPGLNWVELAERMQSRVGGFVLLSDRYDAELSADFESDGRFVLPKPVQEIDLARVLDAVERQAAARSA